MSLNVFHFINTWLTELYTGKIDIRIGRFTGLDIEKNKLATDQAITIHTKL